ncbi:Mlp family lipoprotein (plasmid) [Borrelia miyamotoi]|uniref:Mlp family lipoprotein n=1 Tax=Borrelia miyamotoi TaxID=47466 RepID=A0AAX3JPU0_9SPIR|nr:Mlp family lipoprotein [Borrelia miyamotoi]ATQ15409.1 Mlp family lipoprotein [Borrelia miyamotoi]ATQ17820.1 Mlp family lipoprotein [Borrelia miyamotoi]ATQ20293.1 Mlp family lipoprotein [Borrelia miyamotoi]ATQ21499.1 Mlp family lipoprotein [Borrelia miyamotoi]QBK66451.1 Mlp family lipoprotein [Borrelia miyamotoi]
MNKFIKLLILISTLFILYCKGYKVTIEPTNDTQQYSKAKRDINDLHKETDKEIKEKIITLSNDEKKKFDSLKHAFNQVIEKLQEQIGGCQNGNKSKCDNFWTWIDGNPQKQKELANAFTTAHDFLEKKRNEKDNGKNFDQYISEALECKNSDGEGKYGSAGTNQIEQFFRGILNDMSTEPNNDKMFDRLKDELLCTDNSSKHLDGLTSNW